MKVWVCYEDNGPYEGCSAPLAVFSTKEFAEVYKSSVHPYIKPEIEEMEIDEANHE